MANNQNGGKRYTCANCKRRGMKGYKRKGNRQWECVQTAACKKRQEQKQQTHDENNNKTPANRKSRPQKRDETLEQETKLKPSEAVATRNGEPYRKHDWERIRTLFIEGVPADVAEPDGDRDWLNLKELGERLNVPYATLAKRSADERWADKKLAYQAMITRERQQQRAKKIGAAATEFDDKSLTVAQLGVQLVHARLGEIVTDVKDRQQLRQKALAARQQGLPIDPTHLRTAIHSTELERLGKSMLMFQEIGMKALGTDIERHKIEGNVTVEQTVSVSDELDRDDPKRLAGFIAAAHRSDVMVEILKEIEAGESDDIVDAELVDESTTENNSKPDGEQPTKTVHEVVEAAAHSVDETTTENTNGDHRNGKRSINIRSKRNR